MSETVVSEKICKVCRNSKALEDFEPDSRKPDGRIDTCRACRNRRRAFQSADPMATVGSAEHEESLTETPDNLLSDVFTAEEEERLHDLEEKMTRTQAAATEFLVCLAEIKQEGLYRHYGAFDTYVRERWPDLWHGVGQKRIFQLSRAGETLLELQAEILPVVEKPAEELIMELPRSERQLRELADVPEGRKAEVWQEAQARNGSSQPSARAIAEVRQELLPPETPPMPTNAPAEEPSRESRTRQTKEEKEEREFFVKWFLDRNKKFDHVSNIARFINTSLPMVEASLSALLRRGFDEGWIWFDIIKGYQCGIRKKDDET